MIKIKRKKENEPKPKPLGVMYEFVIKFAGASEFEKTSAYHPYNANRLRVIRGNYVIHHVSLANTNAYIYQLPRNEFDIEGSIEDGTYITKNSHSYYIVTSKKMKDYDKYLIKKIKKV